MVAPGNKTILYDFDAAGRRRSTTDPDGGRFTWAYDAAGQLKSVRNPNNQRTTFSYDDAGRRTRTDLPDGTFATFTYDEANQMLRVDHRTSAGTIISGLDYGYDDAGNRANMAEADGARTTWTYDDTNQLLSEHRTGATDWRNTFAYDPAGNRTLKNETGVRTTSTYDDANQLIYAQTTTGRTTYTFDNDGNQRIVLEPSGGRTTNIWDYENRNTEVLLPDGGRVTMSYSPDNRRVNKDVFEPPTCDGCDWCDLFVDVDGTQLTAHTPNVGTSYTGDAGFIIRPGGKLSFEGPNAEGKEVSFDPGFDEWEVRFKAAAPGGDAMFIMYYVGSSTSSGIWLQVETGNVNLLLDENSIYSDTFDNTGEHEYVLRYENDDITLTRDNVQLFTDTIGSLSSTVHHFLAYQESPVAYGYYQHLCIADLT